MRSVVFLLLLCLSAIGLATQGWSAQTHDEFRGWIEHFKQSEKGPFKLIRWFCKDGTVLPPQPGACTPHGGGIQHGQWNDPAIMLRESGYYIGNILAAVDVETLADNNGDRGYLKHILIERYLMAIDDGWIFRGARYYRGAIQIEDEVTGARRLLIALAKAQQNRPRDFLLLRTAARLLPHGVESPDVAQVRRLSTQLGEQDAGFQKLRNKIHSQPDAGDARLVREYAVYYAEVDALKDYLDLAYAIDGVYQPRQLDTVLAELVHNMPRQQLTVAINRARRQLNQGPGPVERLHITAHLLADLRNEFIHLKTPAQLIVALDSSLALEREVFITGTALRSVFSTLSRRQRIDLLKHVLMALYGCGELGLRQWKSMSKVIEQLLRDDISLSDYRWHLRYLSRLNGWVDRSYRYHFASTIEKFTEIEDKARVFIPDQLRGGIMLFGSALLDGMSIDANHQAGVAHELFGKTVGSGLRMLNPGLARGILLTDTDDDTRILKNDAIYVLPETTPELPPVAGILTMGEGNALSHVQILARNLGIPNVVINDSTYKLLRKHHGSKVVMAVSPGGRVLIERDGSQWDSVFGSIKAANHNLIDADVQKLDLQVRDLLELDQLRARDAGRIAGPKAANLGELRKHFPEHVPQGIVIPFGVFHDLLQMDGPVTGQSMFEWMQGEYRRMARLTGDKKQQARKAFLMTVRTWILQTEPGPVFRERLRTALSRHFGEDESYTLFVRSDTNMEDLPGFTGAGLNLTVPNVRGFASLLDAIKQVWASPFDERAFEWRQKRMRRPEHVYISVLLMPSIAVDKSGVMVTIDAAADKPGWITVASNEGIGGAVQGQAAEELRINIKTGQVQLLAEASSSMRRVLNTRGGLDSIPVSGKNYVLSPENIQQLSWLARELPQRYPMLDELGHSTAADVEFGYTENKLVLFQARPYLASRRAQKSRFLKDMDAGLRTSGQRRIRLDEVPLELR